MKGILEIFFKKSIHKLLFLDFLIAAAVAICFMNFQKLTFYVVALIFFAIFLSGLILLYVAKSKNIKISMMVFFIFITAIGVQFTISGGTIATSVALEATCGSLYKDQMVMYEKAALLKNYVAKFEILKYKGNLISQKEDIKKLDENINNLITEFNTIKSDRNKNKLETIKLLESKLSENFPERDKYLDNFINDYNLFASNINFGKWNQELFDSVNEDLDSLMFMHDSCANITLEFAESRRSESIKVTIQMFLITALILALVSWYVAMKISKATIEVDKVLYDVASGNLAIRINSVDRNEFGLIKAKINKTIEQIKDFLVSVNKYSVDIDENAGKLSSLSQQISASTEHVSEFSKTIADSTNEQSASMQAVYEMTSTFAENIDKIVKSVNDVLDYTKHIDEMSKSSDRVMTELNDNLEEITNTYKEVKSSIVSLSENIKKVSKIINVIKDISEQTNLLSLNASIEAAKAGEHGKGFSIISNSIKVLADQSNQSSKEITKILKTVKKENEKVYNVAENAENKLYTQLKHVEESLISFRYITRTIESVLPQLEEVKGLTNVLFCVKEKINSNVKEAYSISLENRDATSKISEFSSQINASISEITESAQELSNISSKLVEKLGEYKLGV